MKFLSGIQNEKINVNKLHDTVKGIAFLIENWDSKTDIYEQLRILIEANINEERRPLHTKTSS